MRKLNHKQQWLLVWGLEACSVFYLPLYMINFILLLKFYNGVTTAKKCYFVLEG